MRDTRLLPLALLLVLVAAVAGCANPADGKTEAEVGDAVESGAATAAESAGETYVIGDGSTITWVGSKVTGSHDGGFNEFDGEIVVVDGDPAKSTVTVNIDATSIWADNDRLTGHLKSDDFFAVETYPTATFQSTSIEKTEDGYAVTGNLDLHGVVKSVTFPAQITVDGDSVSAQAEFVLKRFDWGIVYPGKPDDLIRDEVVINLNLQATKAAA